MSFFEGKRGGAGGGPRDRVPGENRPAPIPAPTGPVQAPIGPGAPLQGPVQPAPVQNVKPKGPVAPPELPVPEGGGGQAKPKPKPVARPVGEPAPAPAFERPGQGNLQSFIGARLGAFDPRQRGRADVQQAIERLGGIPNTGVQVSPGAIAPGMVGGLGAGAGFKQFEDQDRLLGVLSALK